MHTLPFTQAACSRSNPLALLQRCPPCGISSFARLWKEHYEEAKEHLLRTGTMNPISHFARIWIGASCSPDSVRERRMLCTLAPPVFQSSADKELAEQFPERMPSVDSQQKRCFGKTSKGRMDLLHLCMDPEVRGGQRAPSSDWKDE